MNALSLYYPVKPHSITRGWGVPDERYRAFGFDLHNGVDIALALGQSISAPLPCRVTKIGYEPHGSGHYVCLLSTERYAFGDDRQAYVEITFMHLLTSIVNVGETLAAGELVAFGGTSGATTGLHTHMAPKRVRRQFARYYDIDTNEANGTFDPEPFWNGLYAEDLDANSEKTLARLKQALTKLLESD